MLEIRPCREDDYPAIARLLQQLWPAASIDHDRLRDAVHRGLKSAVHHFLCAEQDGGVIGFCSLLLKNSLWQQGYLAHVDELVVDESARKCGVGTRLLEAVIEIAAKNGASRIELDSAFHRQEAHKFYQQLGFENRALLFSKRLSSITASPHQQSSESKP